MDTTNKDIFKKFIELNKILNNVCLIRVNSVGCTTETGIEYSYTPADKLLAFSGYTVSF
jgi:hypothetical protein